MRSLRVGVVASKGADVVELRFKPRDVDFLWHSPHPLLPPAEYVPTAPTPTGTFFDQYAGGWQESLPAGNGTPRLGDARLGLHGEVSSLPWDVDGGGGHRGARGGALLRALPADAVLAAPDDGP